MFKVASGKKLLLVVFILFACFGILLLGLANFSSHKTKVDLSQAEQTPNSDKNLAKQNQQTEDIAPPEIASPNAPTLNTDPESILVLVNKEHPLQPLQFYPDDLVALAEGESLRSEAAVALNEMFAAAAKDATPLFTISSFRSYEYQKNLYQNYVYSNGESDANTFSAKPGLSEHQTGLAADLVGTNNCGLDSCPTNEIAWKWLSENANNFGFILRYPAGFENITGYIYEPWHFRYIGKEAAQEMKNMKIQTLEQFMLG